MVCHKPLCILSSGHSCDDMMSILQEYKVPEVHAEADGDDQLIRLVSHVISNWDCDMLHSCLFKLLYIIHTCLQDSLHKILAITVQ